MVGLVIEIRSLLASAQTAEGARALFPEPTDRHRRRSPVPAPRAASIDGAATPDSHRQFPLVICRCRIDAGSVVRPTHGQGPFGSANMNSFVCSPKPSRVEPGTGGAYPGDFRSVMINNLRFMQQNRALAHIQCQECDPLNAKYVGAPAGCSRARQKPCPLGQGRPPLAVVLAAWRGGGQDGRVLRGHDGLRPGCCGFR